MALCFAMIRQFAGIKIPLSADTNTVPGEELITPVNYSDPDETSEFYDDVDADVSLAGTETIPYEEVLDDSLGFQQDSQEDVTDLEDPSAEAESADDPVEADMSPDATAQTGSRTDGRKKHRILGVHSWTQCFPDINDVQLVAAKKNGVKPVSSREEAEEYVRSHKLVNITNSPYYTVDDLKHSMPYLVPKAQQLLNTICLNFIDSLQVKGMPLHLPMVTSVLRTANDVSKLQRGNKNATTNSCHCYGTTVDITYTRFSPLTGEYNGHAPLMRWNFQMKQILAEVLRDLREQGLCYVKYEHKQACFHLTVR